jgi:hypothetical protein
MRSISLYMLLILFQPVVSRTKHDIHPMQTNADPSLHPLEAAREYKRALNAGEVPTS